MDKTNNKKLKTKNSIKNIKNTQKTIKNKQSLITSARTPRSAGLHIDFRKYPLEKFKSIKSIPTITYRDIQTTIFPTQIHENQENFSYLNHTQCKLNSQIEPTNFIKMKKLLSDRRLQKSVSLQKTKQEKALKKKNKLKYLKGNQNQKKQQKKQRRNTTLNPFFEEKGSQMQKYKIKIQENSKRNTFQDIVKRTSQLLSKYKRKQQEWRAQKKELIIQIQKYKRKANGKSTTTTTSSHNSQSHKLLI